MHYAQRDLLAALTAYDELIEQHPTSPEASYSRSQMHNIVRSVIPAPTLLASGVALARRQLQQAGVATPARHELPRPTERTS